MENFSDIIISESAKKNSVLVVGLDPDLSNFPHFITYQVDTHNLETIENAIVHFNTIVIDSVYPHALAVKTQLAYYELYGSYGIRGLEKTIKYAKSKGLIVINDAKRGDIDSTSAAYAKAFLSGGPLTGDMMTVNPFMGSDSYWPFIEEAEKNKKGIFLLLKTSNPSSDDFQNQILKSGKKFYAYMAEQFYDLTYKTIGRNGYSYIGFVVGASQPEAAKEIRKMLPYSLFLVPGFGFQGGKADKLGFYFSSQGNGALISSTRAIIYCYKMEFPGKSITEEEMKKCIGAKALKDNADLNKVRKQI